MGAKVCSCGGKMEGARGIEPPPRCSDEADGFEDRGVPSTIAPEKRDYPESGFTLLGKLRMILNRLDQTAEYGSQLTFIQFFQIITRLFPIHDLLLRSGELTGGLGSFNRELPTATTDLGNRQFPIVFYPAVAVIVAAGIEQVEVPALLERHQPVTGAQVVFDAPFDAQLSTFSGAPGFDRWGLSSLQLADDIMRPFSRQRRFFMRAAQCLQLLFQFYIQVKRRYQSNVLLRRCPSSSINC